MTIATAVPTLSESLRQRNAIIHDLIPRKIWILNKRKEWQLLTPNYVQKLLIASRTPRDDYLKSRRLGLSTFFLGEDLVGAAYYGERNVLVAQDRESARLHLETLKQMYRRLPKSDRIEPREDNKNKISFANSDGYVEILTVKQPNSIRGKTLDRLHWTEPAFASPKHASELFQAAREAVSHGIFSMESTAQGANGLFYEKTMEIYHAELAGQAHEWKLHFYPWWLGEDNFDEGWNWEMLGDLSDEEAKLVAANELSAGQIAWRRRTIADMPRGIDQFYEEYPESVVGAFLQASGSFFPASLIKRLREETIPPIEPVPTDDPDLLRAVDRGLRVYEKPQFGCWYIVGADCGGGGEARVAGSARQGIDASAAYILCCKHLKCVATYFGVVPPEPYAEMLLEWAELYNRAYIAAERNGFGEPVNGAIQRTGYPHIHVEEVRDSRDWAYGWYNSGMVRPTMLSEFRDGLTSGAHFTQAQELVDEMTTFVGKVVPSGDVRYAAPNGVPDNLIMAGMAAWFFRDRAPSPQLMSMKAWRDRPSRWG